MSRMNHPTIEIYPMKRLSNGDSTLATTDNLGLYEEPDFYDVLVRFDGDDPIEEVENLPTFEDAWAVAEGLQIKYPKSDIEEING